MALKHPYCRTCGSRIQSEDVCSYCGCMPLAGRYFCCDCAAETMPEAIMCVHCGAKFQGKFPATLAFLISAALVVAIAGGVYVSSQIKSGGSKSDSSFTPLTIDSTNKYLLHPDKKNEMRNTIINHISVKPVDKKNEVSSTKNNIIKDEKLKVEPVKKEIISKENSDKEVEEKTVNKISTNAFSSSELSANNATCTYFEGKHKGNVIFFTNNIFGYIKINGRLCQLRGIEKGSDIARFTGAGYTVTIEIEGLAGSEKEWLASATMVVEDVRLKILSRHRIFSSCTEF